MDQIIKVLGIAPYEGMKVLLERLVKQRKEIELTVFVGDLNTGLDIAINHSLQDYDIILSRGGTAQLISKHVSIPVVEIKLSAYDILRAIKLAENFTSEFAIVGFPSITKDAEYILKIFHYKIDIFTIHHKDEVYQTLNLLTQKGYGLVLCDVVCDAVAQKLGISSILCTSGSESILEAFDQVIQTVNIHEALLNKTHFLQSIIEDNQSSIFVYNENANLVYSTHKSHITPSILNTMQKHVSDIMYNKDKKIYREEKGTSILLHGVQKIVQRKKYIVYYMNTKKVPLSLKKNGIQYYNCETPLESLYLTFYDLNNNKNPNRQYINKIKSTLDPIFLLGEPGCDLDQMAKFIYSQSPLQNNPLVIIDCRKINDKSIEFLTEHVNSPLCDKNTTVYFHQCEVLSEDYYQEIFYIIKYIELQKTNKLIFSSIINNNASKNERFQQIINEFSCSVFHIPPLRNMVEQIPNLANIYISTLNMQLAKEILGLENESILKLQEYHWPYNFLQFKRIIRELVIETDTFYIQPDTVSRLLSKEVPNKLISVGHKLDLHKTLEEINIDILKHIISEEGGNKTAVAKRLGISRTTLWRMLQNKS